MSPIFRFTGERLEIWKIGNEYWKVFNVNSNWDCLKGTNRVIESYERRNWTRIVLEDDGVTRLAIINCIGDEDDVAVLKTSRQGSRMLLKGKWHGLQMCMDDDCVFLYFSYFFLISLSLSFSPSCNRSSGRCIWIVKIWKC